MDKSKVINFPRKPAAFSRNPPRFPKQRLTRELLRKLMNAPGPYNLLAVFAEQHPGEFFNYVAIHHPKQFREWAWQALKANPQLRRRFLAESQRVHE